MTFGIFELNMMLNTFQVKEFYFETYFAIIKEWFVNLLAD